MGRVRLGREYAGWYGTADQRLGGDVVLAGRGDDGIPVIVSPVTGTTYFLDGDHPMEGQRLVLRAETECQWHSDTLRMQQREGRVEVELVPGRHRIEARNRAGRAETWIEVRGL
jgi:FKBP-type peptidyl-prolyl cis-trans isomerase 2